MTAEIGELTLLIASLAIVAIVFVVWLRLDIGTLREEMRGDMKAQREEMREDLRRLEARVAAVERGQAIAGRAPAE